MGAIEATAPGKIILFGEHAVVYSRPAIAVPVINIKARAVVQPAGSGAGFRIIAPDIEQDYLFQQTTTSDPLAVTIQLTLDYFKVRQPPDIKLTITSSIPLGRGLGSGAAVSAAVVRALSQFLGQSISPEAVSDLVYEVEKLHHGTPSGIDNSVVVYAQPIYFIKGKPIQRMRVSRPFKIVIGDTGLISPTHQVVGDLRRRWQARRARYEGYFDELAAIAHQARVIVEQGRSNIEVLGKLMDENQEILTTLELSSPELTRLVSAARQAGALGAKLSGAGWGGNMIALVPAQPAVIASVRQALIAAGATGVIVTDVC